jgi:hypothetical protein
MNLMGEPTMNLSSTTRAPRLLLGCAIASILYGVAQADVTIEERVSVSGAGMMKMANMSGKTVTTISGQRARTDSDMRFESGLVRTFARGAGQGSEIVRLDEDKMYSLDNAKKTYTETTFAEQRAEMQKAMDQMKQSQEEQQQATSGVDESECEWSEPKADVTRTDEKATIAGYAAEHVTIVATQSCKNPKTGEVCDFGLMLDQWVAPDFQASAEAQAYYKAYAEKMGFGATASRDFAERAQSMFARYEGIWKEVAAKMQDVKGHPVKASFGLGVGGPQCQSTQQTQASGGPTSPPSIGGALGGALGGMFGKKKEKEAAPPPPEPTAMPGGLMPLMTISTELLSVNTGGVNAAVFEVPAGYKKANR